jgi:RHS repeat-associated protein
MLFTGQFLDSATELYDLRARQYDTSTGQFLTEDPSSASGSADGSSYAYADGCPKTDAARMASAGPRLPAA